MNKPFPSQNELNFAAVSFAIQYYRVEHRIAHAFKYGGLPGSEKAFPKYQVILEWVAHFAVTRNFVGFGALSVDDRRAAYERIFDYLSSPHCVRLEDESIADRVLRVEAGLRDELRIRSSLLSATTKLLWLVDQSSIIYDGRLRKAMATPDGDYRAYCEKWEQEFRSMSSALESAVVGLTAVTHLFPKSWDLRRDTRQHWFMARVFDTFHWLEAG